MFFHKIISVSYCLHKFMLNVLLSSQILSHFAFLSLEYTSRCKCTREFCWKDKTFTGVLVHLYIKVLMAARHDLLQLLEVFQQLNGHSCFKIYSLQITSALCLVTHQHPCLCSLFCRLPWQQAQYTSVISLQSSIRYEELAVSVCNIVYDAY